MSDYEFDMKNERTEKMEGDQGLSTMILIIKPGSDLNNENKWKTATASNVVFR